MGSCWAVTFSLFHEALHNILLFYWCSWGKCLIFWCMLLNAASRIALTQTVVGWKDYFAMVCNAEPVLLEVVFSARRCGIFFNCMLGLVKNQTAMYRDAGEYHPSSPIFACIMTPHKYLLFYVFLQGSERPRAEITAAIWFPSKSSSDGDDETACSRSCGEQWVNQFVHTGAPKNWVILNRHIILPRASSRRPFWN